MNKLLIKIAPIIILIVCMNIIINTNNIDSSTANMLKTKKFDMTDSILSYAKNCDIYLGREIFKGTPLTGNILAKAAYETYKETGILVPYELVLSQAQTESHMGLKGLSKNTNPFNVGEWDGKTVRTFNTTYEGTLAYYKLITNDYIKYRSIDELRKSFTNKNGHRYASDPDYEKKIFRQFDFIKRWINKNFKKK